MTTSALNFPVGLVVDGFCSFLQNRFSNPEVTPPTYRWNADDSQSRVRISGPYSTDNAKPGSIPSITVRRGTMQFAKRGIDNLKSADKNVLTNPIYEDWMDSSIDFLIETGSASESSSLANFLAIEIQANRHYIREVLTFIRYISYMSIGPEVPVEQTGVTIRRWQVMLTFNVSVYIGWTRRSTEDEQFDKMSLRNVSSDSWSSETGEIVAGEMYLTDNSADFGLLNTSNPQLLSSELQRKWYYVSIGDDPKLYTVEQIVNNHKLRLSDIDEKQNIIPYNPELSMMSSYKVLWNDIHLHFELPKKG